MIAGAALLLAAAAWIGWPGDARRRCRRPVPSRPIRPEPGGLAATVDLVSVALDAGLAPAAAVSAVAAAQPPGTALRRAAAMVDVTGQPAWDVLVDDPELGRLAAAMARSQSSGAPVAEAIRVLTGELRRAERAERLSRARRVGVRTAAPLGLCFLPAFFVVAVVPTVVGLLGSVL
jgi:pilus assembly protein TadC